MYVYAAEISRNALNPSFGDVDSIKRQNRECEAKNKPFTFDAEAVCGIKLSTMVTSSASATGSASGTTSAASATTTSESTASAVSAITSAGPWIAVPTESQTTSAATATPTDNAAAGKMARWEVVAGLVVAAGMLG
ncbi:hypothetical protein PHISCL_08097 [Aspergillus sclerotialis]|uniref:Uncharacterized protein n=1 Tax=Aspergillus sclerotialis TaxID=2070753 RepID=A0A3A2ZBD3_9EURO|nr:hypothetical protein PHISCL_08097 [Aspergillus sclerotialis]